MTPARLRRLRWAVRATLTLGVTASVTANVLHARSNPISQAIAAWPPFALLITVEVVSRIPLARRGLGIVRVAATTTIAGIAAWISYWHMVSVVARYGETGTVPYLLPISVDGLIVVASVSLIELSARQHTTEPGEVEELAVTGPTTVIVSPAMSAVAAQATDRPQAPEAAVSVATLEAGASTRPEPDLGREPTGGGCDNHLAATPEPNLATCTDLGAREEDDTGVSTGGEADNSDDGGDLAVDLVPLLPAARAARDELTREGNTVSRDALARRLRRNGYAIRNDRVSGLLNILRREEGPLNGARPNLPV